MAVNECLKIRRDTLRYPNDIQECSSNMRSSYDGVAGRENRWAEGGRRRVAHKRINKIDSARAERKTTEPATPRCLRDGSFPKGSVHEGCTWMRSRECVEFDRATRRDSMHRHRFLLAPRCACMSISDVLSEADVEGDESCDISIRGCPKGRVPEVDPPLPRPDESNFNNDHCDYATFRPLPTVSSSPIHSPLRFLSRSLSLKIV